MVCRDPSISSEIFLAKWLGESNEQNAGIIGTIFVKWT